ncbi:MAG: hypothetical protein ABSF88_09165 [Candidatus Aminicenantales bacterium]
MGIISDVQLIGKALQKAGNIDLYNKLIEIQEKIIDTQRENQELREEVARLNETLKTKDSVYFENNAIYKNGKDGIKTGPYCSGCWDSENKLINLHESATPGIFTCPICRKNGGTPKRGGGQVFFQR